MQVVTPDLIKGKKVLLRFDIDVELKEVGSSPSTISATLSTSSLRAGKWAAGGEPRQRREVGEDFRLKAGLPTLRLCLEHAEQVVMMGHIGRPEGKEVPELSVEPIYDWLANYDDLRSHLESLPAGKAGGKLKLLENLRFENGESFDSAQDEDEVLEYAKELASYGDFYVNEAFAAHHKAASTTVLPTLLPHAAGLRFAEEVRKLSEVRENPKRPLVVMIGGVKIEDKLPAIEAMAKIANHVLVGGRIVTELLHSFNDRGTNVKVAGLKKGGMDISDETVEEWKSIIKQAGMIVWNGPLGKVDPSTTSTSLSTGSLGTGSGKWTVDSLGSTKGTYEIAKAIIESNAESIIGGGDTLSVLSKMRFLSKFSFVSVGGGAMLKLLADGTLPTIEALS